MSGIATEAGAAQGKNLSEVSLGILREGWDMEEGDLTFCKWKRREQTLLHQPLAVSSACHCRDVMVGPCAVFSVVGIYGLIEACYHQRGEGRGRRDGLTSCCQEECRESITQSASSLWEAAASAAGPVSGKSSTLHQLSKREEKGGREEESPA